MSTQAIISQLISENDVVLFMKGSATFPQCGFSAKAVQLIKACGVSTFKTVDVLQDPDIRQGIKDFSNWPTVPQLYVRGEFIGGSDILQDMYEDGELQTLLAQ
ncbi:MAG: Grx4 family monothiol glutaredoxin [Neisseriaceae bacterium]|nr:Grx4 family monothiol glutaredoxin [Neisseriaceae bacterium]